MRSRVRFGVFLAAGLAVAAVLVLLVAPRASSEPDGLERVAQDEGFSAEAEDHALSDAPTADYGVEGIDDEALGTGVAGLIGIAVTFAIAGGLFLLLRRTGRGRGPTSDAPPAEHPAPSASP